MPISQGIASALPGLELKAWALLAENGGIVRSSGVTSMVRDSGSGKQTWTFEKPMAGLHYFGVYTPSKKPDNTGIMPTGALDSAAVKTVNDCVTATKTGTGGNVYNGGGYWAFYE